MEYPSSTDEDEIPAQSNRKQNAIKTNLRSDLNSREKIDFLPDEIAIYDTDESF